MARVSKTETCWLWVKGAKDGFGYGMLRHNGKVVRAHIVSYLLFKGEIPAGMVVRHDCDTPACVNPDHLQLGTPADNTRDRDSRGRHTTPTGQDHPRAKLTEQNVLQIRSERTYGNAVKLALRYGVTKGTIHEIWCRMSWRHI